MNEVEIQAMISALENQRNAAQNQVAQLTAKLVVSELKIRELNATIANTKAPESKNTSGGDTEQPTS